MGPTYSIVIAGVGAAIFGLAIWGLLWGFKALMTALYPDDETSGKPDN